MDDRDTVFSWGFLRAVAHWSLAVSAAVAVAGWLLTGGFVFPASFAVAAGLDILTLDLGISRSRQALAEGEPARLPAGIFAARLVGKAALLVVAALLLDDPAAFWGVVTGSLVVDTTVLLAGSVTLGLRMVRQAGAGHSPPGDRGGDEGGSL